MSEGGIGKFSSPQRMSKESRLGLQYMPGRKNCDGRRALLRVFAVDRRAIATKQGPSVSDLRQLAAPNGYGYTSLSQ